MSNQEEIYNCIEEKVREHYLNPSVWKARAEQAEAEVERLRADSERYLWLIDNIDPADAGLREPVDYWTTKDPVWKQQIDAAIDAARGES